MSAPQMDDRDRDGLCVPTPLVVDERMKGQQSIFPDVVSLLVGGKRARCMPAF